jgi:peptide/nickel transport system permease protein
LKQLFKNRDQLFWGIVFLFGLVLLALLGPWIYGVEPDVIDISRRLLPPSAGHWLGTDDLGRDVAARMLNGARVSLSVGTAAVLMATFIGVCIGAVAGYAGRWMDAVLMRLVDILQCIPTLYLILMLIVLLKPGIFNVVIVIALTGWTGIARLVRAEILSLKQREFVLSARAAGAHPLRIVFRHLIPNALGPVWVNATFAVAGAIMMESGLSFLGLGVQPPTASWGSILEGGRAYIQSAWWLTVFPGLAILAAMLIINMIGEGLRQRFDPREQAL